MLGRVEVGDLVLHERVLGEDEKAVRKAYRHPQHAVRRRREMESGPLAEGGRAAPQVDHHVVDLAEEHLHELALRLADLVVQAAQHVTHGERLVVLYELDLEAGRFIEPLAVIALEKMSPPVGKYLWLEDENVWEVGADDAHRLKRQRAAPA